MPKGIKGWLIWAAAQAVLTFAIRLIIKLLDNAAIGWGDEQIALRLGISSPNVQAAFTWAVPFALAAIALFAVHYATRRHFNRLVPRARYADKDAALVDSIYWVAFTSAWGRWQAAQQGGKPDEYTMMQSAASYVLKAAGNGDLIVRGRIPASSRYEQIDRHFWLGHLIHIEGDPVHLWKAVVYERPTNKIVAAAYDGYLVEAYSVETLWPQTDWHTDWTTIKINAGQRLRALYGGETSEMGATLITIGLMIAVVGLLLIGTGVWVIGRTSPSLMVATASPVPAQASIDPVQSQPIATVSPRAQYDKSEISVMLSALRKLNELVDKKYAPAQRRLSDALYLWDGRVRADLTNDRLEEIQKDRNDLVGARQEILQLLKDGDFYRTEFSHIASRELDANSSMQSALDQFISDVKELSQHEGIDLPKFAHPALDRLQAENDKMGRWVVEVKQEIQDKSRELRD